MWLAKKLLLFRFIYCAIHASDEFHFFSLFTFQCLQHPQFTIDSSKAIKYNMVIHKVVNHRCHSVWISIKIIIKPVWTVIIWLIQFRCVCNNSLNSQFQKDGFDIIFISKINTVAWKLYFCSFQVWMFRPKIQK